LAPGKPVIETPPADQKVLAGADAFFSVRASGEGRLAFQWRRNDVELTGETNDTLRLRQVLLADSRSYYSVAVSNALGLMISPSALLTVEVMEEPHIVGTARDDHGAFHLTVSGEPGHNYTLEYSTSLSPWEPLTTVSNSTGVVQFIDDSVGTRPQCFYRIVRDSVSEGPRQGLPQALARALGQPRTESQK
jgi:hypothetical protein